jgi:hypothetical protein
MLSPSDTLADAIRRRRAILFVGAGVSMSIGLPSWDALIDHMLEELKLDRSVIQGMNGGYQMVAEFYRLKQGSMAPLRAWLDQTWQDSSRRISSSIPHKLIVELNFPIIYTTNYDRNLEAAFEFYKRPYAKIANAKDIANAADGATQIVKYHGDLEDDESLILTETDFLDRLSFDSPLDVKFRADALGRTVLFIGYSMSDPNIRLLLHRIWGTWKNSGFEKHRPESFVFMHAANPIQKAVLARWGITALAPGGTQPPDVALTSFLMRLKDRTTTSHFEGDASRSLRDARQQSPISKAVANPAKLANSIGDPEGK